MAQREAVRAKSRDLQFSRPTYGKRPPSIPWRSAAVMRLKRTATGARLTPRWVRAPKSFSNKTLAGIKGTPGALDDT